MKLELGSAPKYLEITMPDGAEVVLQVLEFTRDMGKKLTALQAKAEKAEEGNLDAVFEIIKDQIKLFAPKVKIKDIDAIPLGKMGAIRDALITLSMTDERSEEEKKTVSSGRKRTSRSRKTA